MHGLEAEYGDQIRFVYLDIDDRRTNTFKQALGYRYQPHIFLLDGSGNVLAQFVGAVGADELEAAFQQVLQ